ncbi:MAG: hypothetical protein JNK82_37210 [Myxococcaceae bacterium]|nr:hypothetical protein [Myxococcaceae bacterium]
MIAALLLAAAPLVDADVTKFWSPPNVARLQRPARVELFRVRPHSYQTPEPPLVLDAGVIGGYVVTESRGAVPVERVRPLVDVLLDRSTYSFRPGIKRCGGFHPGLAARFSDDAGVTDVLLCFQCDDVGWVERAPRDPRVRGKDDLDPSPWALKVEDMGPGRIELLDAAAALFPDDDVKALSARHDADRRTRAAFWAALPREVHGLVKASSSDRLAGALPVERLLAASFDALGVRDDWQRWVDGPERVVADAAARVSPAAFAESLPAHPDALRGAARLFFLQSYATFEPALRAATAVRLSRAVFHDVDVSGQTLIVSRLAELAQPEVTAELVRIVESAKSWQPSPGWDLEPSGALAYAALARRGRCVSPTVGGRYETVELGRAWCGTAPLRALPWQGSEPQYVWALELIEKRPTRHNVEVLVEQRTVDDEVTFALLRRVAVAAGRKSFPTRETGRDTVSAWWRRERATWR